MKKSLSVLVCIALILSCFSACNSQESDKIYNDAVKESSSIPDTESSQESGEDEKLSGKLTLKTPDNSYWKEWIKMFNKKYPDVTVELIGVGTDRLTYATQTITELMSGEPTADIVDMCFLPYFRCIDSGLFENLITYMDNDPVVKKDELYTNLLDAVTYKDSIAGLPLAVTAYAIRLNTNILDSIEVTEIPQQSDFVQMMDWYQKALETGAVPTDLMFMPTTYNPYTCFGLEYHRYFDEQTGTVSFNSPDFAAMLKAMKTVNWDHFRPEPTGPDAEELKAIYRLELADNIFSADIVDEFLTPMSQNLFKASDSASSTIILTASDGKVPFNSIVGPAGIPVVSENKELAWRFLRFFLSEMDCEGMLPYEGDYYGPTPLNRKNTLQMAKAVFGEDQESIDKMDSCMKSLNSISVLTTNEVLYNDLGKIFNDFYINDLITAEECGQKMQERAEIFLKE